MKQFEAAGVGAASPISTSQLVGVLAELRVDASPPAAVEVLFDGLGCAVDGTVKLYQLRHWLMCRPDAKEQMLEKLRGALYCNGERLMRALEDEGLKDAGYISAEEFGRVLQGLGFGMLFPSIVSALYETFNGGCNGRVSISELNRHLLRRLHTKAMVRSELRQGLRTHGTALVEILRRQSEDGEVLITESHLRQAIDSFGLCTTSEAVRAVFDELDANGKYQFTIDHFVRWLRNPAGDECTSTTQTATEKADTLTESKSLPASARSIRQASTWSRSLGSQRVRPRHIALPPRAPQHRSPPPRFSHSSHSGSAFAPSQSTMSRTWSTPSLAYPGMYAYPSTRPSSLSFAGRLWTSSKPSPTRANAWANKANAERELQQFHNHM